MIASVTWQYILLTGSSATGFRVKRRSNGPPPMVNSGIDTPMSNNWVSQPAPKTIHYAPDNQDYIFAFWSLTANDPQSQQASAQIQYGTSANDSHLGGSWTISAKAYYVWDRKGGGTGPGGIAHGALLIDAFDVQAGDFIPDDFVDVLPGPNAAQTAQCNDGYLDTTANIAAGASLTVEARDAIPGKAFGYWHNIDSLQSDGNAQSPATVGNPNPHDIVVHRDDVVVAFAFYNEVPRSKFVPPEEFTYDPWWKPKTLGGLVPPPPRDPWVLEFGMAVSLAVAANPLSARLRAKVLEIAVEQMSASIATLKREIGALEKR